MNRFRNLMAIFATFAPDGVKGGGGDDKSKGGGTTDDLESKLLRMVNAAVTSQLGRKLDPGLADSIAALTAKVEALSLAPKIDDKSKDKGGTSPELAALQAQVEALTNQIAEKDSSAKETTKKHQEEQLVAQIRENLTQAGVKKELMDGAVATVRAKMTINEETGGVTYRRQNDGWHEDITPEAGLKAWTDSDTGKAHLAPVQAGGAGTTPPGGGRPGAVLNPASLPTDPAARAQAIKAHKIAVAKQSLRKHTATLMGGGRVQLSGGLPEGGEG